MKPLWQTTPRSFNNVRLEDIFCCALHRTKSNAERPNRYELVLQILNPFQVSGSVEMPSISALRKFHNCIETALGALAEIIGNRPLGQTFIVLKYNAL